MLSLLCVWGVVIMAEEAWIDVYVENEDEVILNIDIYAEIIRQRMKNLLEELAKDGVTLLGKNAPDYSGYTRRHIDRDPVSGTADTGEYETIVGVKRGASRHPIYADVGTGIYSYTKKPYTTKLPGGTMWFYASRAGKRIGVQSVQGQQAQHFLYATYRELRVFAQARMLTGAY